MIDFSIIIVIRSLLNLNKIISIKNPIKTIPEDIPLINNWNFSPIKILITLKKNIQIKSMIILLFENTLHMQISKEAFIKFYILKYFKVNHITWINNNLDIMPVIIREGNVQIYINSKEVLSTQIYKKGEKNTTQLRDLKKKLERYKQKIDLTRKMEQSDILDIKKLQYDRVIPTIKQLSEIKNTDKTQNYLKLSLNKQKNIVKFISHKNSKKLFKNLETQKQDFQGPSQIAQRKFQNYKKFLYALQISYSSYKNLEGIKKYDKNISQRYKIYIGPGNNKNLIVSIFKKRWWWKIIQKSNEADFIWTQIKDDTIFQLQQTGDYHVTTKIYTENKNEKIPQYLWRIYHKKDQNILLLNNFGNFQKNELILIKDKFLVHNHFCKNQMVGNKKALFKNLQKYCNFTKKNLYQLIPLTFHIENNKSLAYNQFCKRIRNHKDSYWIIKPGQNTNRGRGIKVSNNFFQIKKIITANSIKHTSIVQLYIKNLFLYQKRKFDIRTYLLLSRVNNVLKAYWYRDGYLRTSSSFFDLEDFDPLIHLTNDAIQKDGQQYGKFEDGNKVSYSDFQRYLDFNYSKEKYQMTNIINQMKKISIQIVNASYFKIDEGRKINNFQIFGLDFIIDKNFKAWLLQVNTNPCLQLSSSLLARLIPTMVQNAIRITLDPISPPLFEYPPHQKYYLSDNFFVNNKFELIFDSRFDRNLQFEEYCKGEKDEYQQQNQVFQNQGVQISLQD